MAFLACRIGLLVVWNWIMASQGGGNEGTGPWRESMAVLGDSVEYHYILVHSTTEYRAILNRPLHRRFHGPMLLQTMKSSPSSRLSASETGGPPETTAGAGGKVTRVEPGPM